MLLPLASINTDNNSSAFASNFSTPAQTFILRRSLSDVENFLPKLSFSLPVFFLFFLHDDAFVLFRTPSDTHIIFNALRTSPNLSRSHPPQQLERDARKKSWKSWITWEWRVWTRRLKFGSNFYRYSDVTWRSQTTEKQNGWELISRSENPATDKRHWHWYLARSVFGGVQCCRKKSVGGKLKERENAREPARLEWHQFVSLSGLWGAIGGWIFGVVTLWLPE